MRYFFCLAILALTSLPSIAWGGLVTGVTATTSMGTFGSYNIANITNGNGLSSQSLTATHTNSPFTTMWISTLGNNTGTITFDLGGSYSIKTMALWNYNFIGAGTTLRRGVESFELDFSTDGSSFTSLLTSQTATRANNGAEPSQLYDLGGVTATHIRMSVVSNFGGRYTGLSEVAFATPEPGTASMLLFAIAPMAFRRRRPRMQFERE